VSHYVANSRFVAARVRTIYGRGAEVIAPPCNVGSFHSIVREPKDFYLFFSALVPYKKADQALDACLSLGKKLVILGHGPEFEALKERATAARAGGGLISFESHASPEKVKKYFSEAKALLFPGIEDFGIVPVEAIAAGLPVIGFREGGLLDSMTDETCLFYEEQTVSALAVAIKKFENGAKVFPTETLKAQSRLFSKEVFMQKVERSLVEFFRSVGGKHY
jgi:glycosyltransferase involved in cell wall biosynthesis